MKHTISSDQRQQAIDLVLNSPELTYKQIAVAVGISLWSVCDIVTHEEPPIRRKRGAGSASHPFHGFRRGGHNV